MASVLDFAADQFYPIAFAVFAAASTWIILRSRRRHAAGSSGAVGVPGMRTAAIATVATVVVVVLFGFALAWVFRGLFSDGYYYGDSPPPAPPPLEPLALLGSVLLPVTWIAVPFLAVLDVYAVWPSPSGDGAGAAGRAVLGLSLVAVSLLVGSRIQGAVASAAGDATRVEDERALEARSAGLSIEVAVVDATLGRSTDHGRVVSDLTLDIRVRSTTDIQLVEAKPGNDNHWINLYTPDALGVQPEQGLELPTHLPAGFDGTYHLEVPVDELTSGRTNELTTGPWEAHLGLYGPSDDTGSQVIYSTTTHFTVPDTP